MATVNVTCHNCNKTEEIVKFGTSDSSKQRYQCQNKRCLKNTFILN